jgi:hypothetical protein
MTSVKKLTRIIAADAPMILKVLAHSWEVDYDFDFKTFQ